MYFQVTASCVFSVTATIHCYIQVCDKLSHSSWHRRSTHFIQRQSTQDNFTPTKVTTENTKLLTDYKKWRSFQRCKVIEIRDKTNTHILGPVFHHRKQFQYLLFCCENHSAVGLHGRNVNSAPPQPFYGPFPGPPGWAGLHGARED